MPRLFPVVPSVALCTLAACGGADPAIGAVEIREEDVRFRNGDVSLAGTLVLPARPGPHPAVVLVQGSGPETRRMYLRYAREFARAGTAALAFDKRGAGESSPVSPRAPFEVLAGDVIAAVERLGTHPAIDTGRIGLWGLSEGEWVAPLAASRMDAPAFLILVSASSVTPSEQVRTEIGELLRAETYPDSVVARAEALYARIAEFQRSGSGRDALNAALEQAAREPWFEDARYLERSVPPYEQVLELSWFPTWRSNMDFDALPLLEKLDCPVLILLGGKDPKNDAALAATRYRDVLDRRGTDRYRIETFPDAEHAMVEWWLPFHLPPPRYPEGYFELQTEWIREQVFGTSRPAVEGG